MSDPEIRVRATPMYLPQESDPAEHQFLWAYAVEIENRSDVIVQLLTRHWRIAPAHGLVQAVDGDGVVGKQPVLRPGEKFRYTSACPLNTPNGMMSGQYGFQEVLSGRVFRVEIPAFALESPHSDQRAN